jgi:hypothetical protein
MMNEKPIIITTINGLTKGIEKFASFEGWFCIIAGDRKTPSADEFKHPKITFIPYDEQADLGFDLEPHLPVDHYCRKNIGYLLAIRNGAGVIAESDDDNIPYDNWGRHIADAPVSIEVISGAKVVNAYEFFSDDFIWPRGFPLSSILDETELKTEVMDNQTIGIWQCLADNDPDVDAIYRLVNGKLLNFKKREPVAMDKGVYCPFNSQNTIWSMAAFPYLYLPFTVNFRFTDILRGYVAQRGIWEINLKLAFTSASVYQARNEHNLMADFIDEIPCYTQVDRVVDLLDKTTLLGHPADDLRKMYEVLFSGGIVKREELDGVNAWIEDLKK